MVYVDECDEYISTDSLLYSAKKPFELAKERGRDNLVELLQSAKHEIIIRKHGTRKTWVCGESRQPENKAAVTRSLGNRELAILSQLDQIMVSSAELIDPKSVRGMDVIQKIEVELP